MKIPSKIKSDIPCMPDQRVRGLVCTEQKYFFDPDKIIIGNPYKVVFLEKTEIFGNIFDTHEYLFCLVMEVGIYHMNCVYIDMNYEPQKFVLLPTMKFEMERLV